MASCLGDACKYFTKGDCCFSTMGDGYPLHAPCVEANIPEDICSECDAWNVYKNYSQIKECDDLIRRKDALRPFTISWKGERIPETDIDNFPTQISFRNVKKILRNVPKFCPDCGANMMGEHDE